MICFSPKQNRRHKKVWRHFLFTLSLPALLIFSGSFSCQRSLTRPFGETAAPSARVPDYSVIYLIHGDGSYLYHDNEGRAHQSDQEMLVTARQIAARLSNGEVFIYYQQPKKRLLWLFPQNDGRFYYYRRGKLIAEKGYRRHPEGAALAPEAELFRTFGYNPPLETDSISRYLFYFGHSIPEWPGEAYHASFPQASFTINDLVKGLRPFLASAKADRFDILMLSTCTNGTPGSVAALSPLSRFIIASPGDLHLSQMSTLPLLDLIDEPRLPAEELAHRLAQQSFEGLSRRTLTEVTIALYDTRKTAPFLQQYGELHQNYSNTELNRSGMECVDCALLEGFPAAKAGTGVEIFYKPPRFGKNRKKNSHSGWNCWRPVSQLPGE
ncbi:MAG: hypothetical protein WAN36_12780 [Calditrichia bacterium]